jgi:UDP-N-acetylglucosamine 2-epimerase (non-hydrolysing)
MSSTIRVLMSCPDLAFDIIHTNQHYDYKLDAVFFQELELPQPNYNLQVGSHPHGKQTGLMLQGMEEVFSSTRPDVVVVQGDTNTVLAGGLTAAKMHIPVAHLEAGLRSYDRMMPEEVNRVLVDHISRFLLAPTPRAVDNLAREGITEGVRMSGNSVVDAVLAHVELAGRRPESPVYAFPERYILATLHRDSNTDSPERLAELLLMLEEMALAVDMPVLFPAHPRTTHRIRQFHMEGEVARIARFVRIMEPLGYLDFLLAIERAAVVVTDSGGVQEEACILGTPSVTVRTTTERPEAIEVGSNLLTPTRPEAVQGVIRMLKVPRKSWSNPFGDGTTGAKMIEWFRQELAP